MLGSIAQCLDCDEQSDVTDTNKIQPTALFDLLIALEQMGEDEGEDHYSVMELIRTDTISVESNPVARQTTTMPTLKKIKSIDFCYDNDNIQFTLLHCFDICVSVGKLNGFMLNLHVIDYEFDQNWSFVDQIDFIDLINEIKKMLDEKKFKSFQWVDDGFHCSEELKFNFIHFLA